MKTQTLSFDECLTLAQNFLTTKERSCFYQFTALDDNFDREYYCYNELSADDVARLRALKNHYGDTFVRHLDEVFSDPDLIHDFTGGGEILAIDLDHVHHRYGVALHELQPDGTVHTIHTRVAFSDDEYARLLAWHLYDEHLTVNTLRHRDRKLFDSVLDGADRYHTDIDGDCLFVSNPYLITLDEARADADLIVHHHNIERTGAYVGIN